MKKILVYDCDGVLFNSTKAIIGYYNHVFDKFGLERIDWTVESSMRLAMMSTSREIIRAFASSEQISDEMLTFAANTNFRDFIPLMEPSPQIYDTLEKLQTEGHTVTVCTNRGISTQYLFDHFDMGNFFAYTVTANDVAKPKPDPEGLYKIIEKYQTAKENLLFVGDSFTDYYAAKAADVDFLAYGGELEESRILKNHMEIFDYL
ncbi:HAD-superfamily hydrolase, subfamily IA, variant 1 [Denitrovibrio acetiphilus DSM 12809]|uniref:phosphoglycolate phosphatase n=1 Tax=Denitrovibrio acetiphilus (strain DSM 12809 / NBRC 114555 / N2460) TaxID=522772 RepID=D4H875_DENA2|nr:HAD family hydrolase [Denitrovibrio acetiphilus]ADD68224.1 HAD-superfamily hydrolase, subfamily IA, variant 1 [Denitrovibrio acetiphilus DSM 12809]